MEAPTSAILDMVCAFFCFFRDDSLPLRSDWLGDTGRLSPFRALSGTGVLVPLVEAPDFALSAFEMVMPLASSLFFSSSVFASLPSSVSSYSSSAH